MINIVRQVVSYLVACLQLGICFADIEVGKATSVEEFLKREYGAVEGEVRHFDAYFDLNGDGKKEIIVYVYGPLVCGSGGCETLILTQDKTEFRILSIIAISRPPIIVLDGSRKSWRNLAVFVAGGGIIPGYFAELQFNGTSYPENPSIAPARPLKNTPNGKTVIQKFTSFGEGKVLKR